ncbi:MULTISPECIES: UDP-3-O-(3-hydroxymyristoyl)glucosamine N-acyltransferase [Delftia]|jgi:hypothetical protein|uniref:UDP-3-O-(3-hydroxymyristoyl)glucosamine N-acyltransferase n=1 Tax=Delftia TaxID=80865 RepID=UPI0009E2EADE|nr:MULTISPECIES: UDP-3-O-(3-hydroxymyristoyl)glucosamine N-acyltransferase [Delftia]BDE69454.1 hypothetical protein HQS1_05780 [Delftia lacustris]
MSRKWIIGSGTYLDIVYYAWKRSHPEISIEKIEITQNPDHSFKMDTLDALRPDEGTAFVAFDDRFGNFKRMELMQAVLALGFKLEPYISPRSMLSENIQVGPNTFIGDGVLISHGTRIDYNSVLLPSAQIGSEAHVRSSCWIEPGTFIGDGAQIGAHSILRSGAMVSAQVKVGRGCELGWPRRYDKDIAAKTIFDPRYNSPIYVYG